MSPSVLSRDYWLKERIAASVDLEERERFFLPHVLRALRAGELRAGSFFGRFTLPAGKLCTL